MGIIFGGTEDGGFLHESPKESTSSYTINPIFDITQTSGRTVGIGDGIFGSFCFQKDRVIGQYGLTLNELLSAGGSLRLGSFPLWNMVEESIKKASAVTAKIET